MTGYWTAVCYGVPQHVVDNAAWWETMLKAARDQGIEKRRVSDCHS
jgi:hypothetical protein